MPATAIRTAVGAVVRHGVLDARNPSAKTYLCNCGVHTANEGRKCRACLGRAEALAYEPAVDPLEDVVSAPKYHSRSFINRRSRRAFLPRK